jgi:EmrB/QacA subfamily drug resistance transporter
VQYASWRWIFLINLPVGIVALLIGNRRLPNIPRQAVPSLDLPGIILAPLAFASLSYGVNEGSTSWSSINTIGGLLIGALALAAFIVVELRVAQPLLELRVFQSMDFTLAIVTQWIGTIALFGGIFLVPLFMQQVRGYGAFDTGLTLMAQALAAALFMPIGGRLFDRFGARPLTVSGLAAVALATFLLAHLSSTTTGWDLVVPLAMRGMGMSLMMMPLNTHLLNAAPRALVGRVTSLTNALQNVVNSLAIATLSTILASNITANERATQTTQAAGHLQLTAHAQEQATTAAVVNAFNTTLLLIMGIAVVGALIGLTLRRNLAAQQAHAAAPAEGHAGAALEAMAG